MSFLTSILKMLQEILWHKLKKHKQNGSEWPQLQVTVPNLRTAAVIGMFDLSSAPGREKEVVRAPYVRATFLKRKTPLVSSHAKRETCSLNYPCGTFSAHQSSPIQTYKHTTHSQTCLPAGLQKQAMTYRSTSMHLMPSTTLYRRKFPPPHAPYRWEH